jgi:hypothetical protein
VTILYIPPEPIVLGPPCEVESLETASFCHTFSSISRDPLPGLNPPSNNGSISPTKHGILANYITGSYVSEVRLKNVHIYSAIDPILTKVRISIWEWVKTM